MSSRARVLVALAIAGALIRIEATREISGTPLSQMDRWAQTDMHYFDAWARQIAAGDWTSAQVPMPMHRWHREIAGRYLGAHPDVNASLREAVDPEAALWARWMQAPRFYQDPLYSYGVAAAYAAAGRRPAIVIALQLAAGVGTVALIALIATACFGEVTGWCAGVLAVLCGPLVFYEFLLLRDSLVAGAGLLLVWLVRRADANGRPVDYALFAAVAMAACLLKSTFVVVALAMVVVLFVRRVQARAPWRGAAAATLVATAIVLTPLAVRNVAVGAPVFSLAASGPMTFVSANEVRAMPDVGFGIDAPVLTSFLADTDGGWIAAARAAMSGADPRELRHAALAQMGSRLALVRNSKQRELLLRADARVHPGMATGHVLADFTAGAGRPGAWHSPGGSGVAPLCPRRDNARGTGRLLTCWGDSVWRSSRP